MHGYILVIIPYFTTVGFDIKEAWFSIAFFTIIEPSLIIGNVEDVHVYKGWSMVDLAT